MQTAVAHRAHRVVPSSVLGTLVFVGAEVMFFAGLISAFTISRAGATAAQWSPPAGPMLPAVATFMNTVALLVSGALMFVAGRQYARGEAASRTLLLSWALGAAFVVLQGREWLGLLGQGFTMQSGALGAFFYLIVGTHGLHAVGALMALGLAWLRLRRGTLTPGFFLGAQTFWYFVVAVWPIIYMRVYF